MTTLLVSTAERAAVWGSEFRARSEPLLTDLAQVSERSQIEHIACWQPPENLETFPNLRSVISTGAGVDHMPAMPAGVILSRTIAPGIEDMVRDYVVMATLALHRDLPFYLDRAGRGEWEPRPARLSRRRAIGIMGMGRIGRRAAQTLRELGFPIAGWSRSGRPVEGIDVFAQGDLPAFLARSEILVCLLPLTGETRGILGRETFGRLPDGAMLVHAGRGEQLDLDALHRALEGGRIGAAMLDVTDPEPLPQDHWAWRDPRVIVTPHVASHTDGREGARHALAVIEAIRTGRDVPGRVDPARGY